MAARRSLLALAAMAWLAHSRPWARPPAENTETAAPPPAAAYDDPAEVAGP